MKKLKENGNLTSIVKCREQILEKNDKLRKQRKKQAYTQMIRTILERKYWNLYQKKILEDDSEIGSAQVRIELIKNL